MAPRLCGRLGRRSSLLVVAVTAAGLVTTAAAGLPAAAGPATPAARGGPGGSFFRPGNLLLSTSVYDDRAATVVAGKTVLPPGCKSDCAVATDNGSYPQVWNNSLVDGNFGITSKIVLDQLTPSGRLVNALTVPGDRAGKDRLVTSFSSKSELSLHLSTDGRDVTFMGYAAPVDALDVSNSNAPGVVDPTNPVSGTYYRVVADVDAHGRIGLTDTNAYSGDNGRAAIRNNSRGTDVLYLAGNAGNGDDPQPDGVIIAAGAQIATPASRPQAAQHPGPPTPVGSFNVTQLGDPQDKIGKDTNFANLTVFHNVLYYTKGSGSNGVNTVYFLDSTGRACPKGVGVPSPRASLPTKPLRYDPAQLQTAGLQPTNMCILRGFPTGLGNESFAPSGFWFADPNTLYVADAGNGDDTYSVATGTYTDAAAQTGAGLQKWVRRGGDWALAYVLRNGLSLGAPYPVRGYPTGTNPSTGLPWSPASDGLRGITGRVNADGTTTIWAVTSTVSGNADPGADPNRLVAVTDRPHATVPAANSRFTTVRTAKYRQVLRGVSFTPGTGTRH